MQVMTKVWSVLHAWRATVQLVAMRQASYSICSMEHYVMPKITSSSDHRQEWHLSFRYSAFHKTKPLLAVLILSWSCMMCCQGAVSFTSEPRNQTVREGETAHFECVYGGSDLTPAWRINGSIYSHTELPSLYAFNDQDFSLTINSAPGTLSFTSFQCIVGIAFSNRGYLFVEVDQKNVTNCIECIVHTSNSEPSPIETTSEFITTDFSVKITLSTKPSTVNPSDQNSSVSLTILISVTTFVSIILCLCILGCVIFVLCISRKAKASESVQQDIEPGENEAYAAIEKYRRPIKVDNNPAYETRLLNFVSDHRRCKSP